MSARGASFAAVLGRRDVAPLVCASLVGRLPLGMTPLGLVLALRGQHRSYAVAGIVVAAYSVGIAVANPLLGRAVDSYGVPRVLWPLTVAFPAALGAALACILLNANAVVCAVLAGLAGVALPPLGACMRALWPRLVGQEALRSAAYAFEATVQEFGFIVGPLLVATLASALSPADALATSGVLGGLGAAGFAALVGRARMGYASAAAPGGPGGVAAGRGWGGALRSAGVRTLLASNVAVGAAFGAFEVAMPAFAEHHGSRAAACLIIGVLALGSMIGGVAAARVPPRHGQRRRYLVSLVCLAVALVPLLGAPTVAWMTVLALIAGLPIAPGFAACYAMLDTLAVPGTVTETFAWFGTTIVAGAAAGTALGGVWIRAGGYRGALVLSLVAAGMAVAIALARRRTLDR